MAKETNLSSNNMGDLHKMVINDISKMIGWIAIRFNEDLIIQLFIIERDSSMNNIFGFCDTRRDPQTNHMTFPSLQPGERLSFGKVSAFAIVFCLLFCG